MEALKELWAKIKAWFTGAEAKVKSEAEILKDKFDAAKDKADDKFDDVKADVKDKYADVEEKYDDWKTKDDPVVVTDPAPVDVPIEPTPSEPVIVNGPVMLNPEVKVPSDTYDDIVAQAQKDAAKKKK